MSVACAVATSYLLLRSLSHALPAHASRVAHLRAFVRRQPAAGDMRPPRLLTPRPTAADPICAAPSHPRCPARSVAHTPTDRISSRVSGAADQSRYAWRIATIHPPLPAAPERRDSDRDLPPAPLVPAAPCSAPRYAPTTCSGGTTTWTRLRWPPGYWRRGRCPKPRSISQRVLRAWSFGGRSIPRAAWHRPRRLHVRCRPTEGSSAPGMEARSSGTGRSGRRISSGRRWPLAERGEAAHPGSSFSMGM